MTKETYERDERDTLGKIPLTHTRFDALTPAVQDLVNILCALWVNVQVLQVAQYMRLLRYMQKNKKSECLVGTNLGLIKVFDKYLGRTLGQRANFAGRTVHVPPPLHLER